MLRFVPGQRHFTCWSSTTRAHVSYESRLELTRLLYADLDQDATAVLAQPFLLSATVGGRLRRHVPDFLVLHEKDVLLVMGVKPRHLITWPKVPFALGWAREAVLSRGWDCEVWIEPPAAGLENMRFLAGCRCDWLFGEDLLAADAGRGLTRERCASGACAAGCARPAPDVLPVRGAVSCVAGRFDARCLL